MMTILLYGFLGKQFGKVHQYDVKSPAEAIRALGATLKGFKQALAEGGHFKVVRGGKEALELHSLGNPQSTRETIRIVPTVAGAGDDGIGSIILGAALIAVGMPMAGSMGLGAAFSAGAWGAVAGNIMVNFGMSLLIGGVSQMLFAPTQTGTSATSVEAVSNRPSYAFDGAVNTAAQGNPVSICYGRLIVGSQVISAGLVAEQT